MAQQRHQQQRKTGNCGGSPSQLHVSTPRAHARASVPGLSKLRSRRSVACMRRGNVVVCLEVKACGRTASRGRPSSAPKRGVAGARLTRSGFLGERSEEHTSELQSQSNLVCRLLLEKKNGACSDESTREIWAVEVIHYRGER